MQVLQKTEYGRRLGDSSFRLRVYLLSIISIVCLFILGMTPTIHATGVEDGEVAQHAMLDFEANIKHSDIIDGTAPFDANNQPGNDNGDKNNVVRSWDTITIPIKITVNPKKADMLENIELRLSGELVNGVSGDRINGKFAVGGTESIPNKKVTFEQDYTVERTGNSIMIPVAIDVLGAKHGVALRPDIKVEVVSVNGEKIKGVVTHFDSLPEITTSAEVSIKPYIGSGLAGQGMTVYPYAGITGDENDMENTHAFAVSWGVDRLPGKSDIRGATFPDPNGEINYKIDLSGSVAWDAKPAKTGTETFNFKGRDTPFKIYDHQPINTTVAKIGRENMVADGVPYKYNYRHTYSAAQSQLPNLTKATIDKEGYRMVWDSGNWDLSSPTVNNNSVSYKGSNTDFVIGSTFPRNRSDGYTGSNQYGVNDKIFSSHSFVVLMPNDYRIGGPNNSNGWANNANYRASITLENYVDENGKVTTFNKTGAIGFTERNNPSGSYSLQMSLFSYPSGRQLGTPNIGDSTVSKGDVTTLIGEDVQIVGYLYPKMTSYGGHQTVFRWNTDAFELTKTYAATAKANLFNSAYYNASMTAVRGNPETQHVFYGVAKFPDAHNKFEVFTTKGKDDYEWFTEYEDAIKKGAIGAMRLDVTAATAGRTHSYGRIPLRVKHDSIGIGALTKEGTAAITLVNYYAYPDSGRNSTVDVTGNRSYHNPAIWDDTGTLLNKQSPSGSSVNFETLAVIPAETGSALTSNKSTYYNSETISWTARNSIVIPESGIPDDLDAGVQVTHTLPRGLNYKAGSGAIGNTATEPEVTVNSNNTTTLTWELLVSNSNHSIPNVTFQTTINPFALGAGVQSSLEVTSVIASELDQRPVHLRRSTNSVTILKVGMVGIYQTINKTHGDKNSDFTITLNPYTTIEDERNVVGATVIPLTGDALGSKYSGSAKIKNLKIKAEREHKDDRVRIYLNPKAINDNRPHEIDVTKNGWFEYTGQAGQLDNAKSMIFLVEGLMTNRDDIQVEFTVQTANNAFGDIYLNDTVINSDTDYRLSPISNRVRYAIRADLELALERMQIYTDKHDKGLPVSVRVSQVVLDAERVKDQNITLAIYDKSTGDKVTEKKFKQKDLQRENEMIIPASVLKKADKKNFEVRIQGFNTDLIWVRDGDGELNTDGHTAISSVIRVDGKDKDGALIKGVTVKPNKDVEFKGVIMTERVKGGSITEFNEKLTVTGVQQPSIKTGYGFALNSRVDVASDLSGSSVIRDKVGALTTTELDVLVDKHLLDDTLVFEGAGANTDTSKQAIRMYRELSSNATTYMSDYQLPIMYLEQGSGKTYTENQKVELEASGYAGELLDGGRKLYTPIWLESGVGVYDFTLKNVDPLGSHRMGFNLVGEVNVSGNMFYYIDTATPDDDEILVHPMPMSEIQELFGTD